MHTKRHACRFYLWAFAFILPHFAPAQVRPQPNQPGPWDCDVLVYRTGTQGQPMHSGHFERAGVPTAARLANGRIVVAHQHFPIGNDADFDKVAVRFSSDEGRTWTTPRVIKLNGLPEGMRFPFDPTLVPLPDGRVRLYFTSVKGRNLNENPPAIYSAISKDCEEFTVEPGMRFGVSGRIVIDCAVVLHQGVFHLFSPDNGGANEGPVIGRAYHATSNDGLNFTRGQDLQIDGQRRWLGNAQSDGKRIHFFGTGGPGGIWIATSPDGSQWTIEQNSLQIMGADPGAVLLNDNTWLFAVTGPPREGTPSARRGPAR